MPAPKFEDLIAEMEEAGVDPDFIDRAKAAFDASPLRQELKAAKAEAQANLDRATKAEDGLLSTTFSALGIKAKPTAFNLPSDLDRTDRDAVQTWAVDQGLIDPPQPNVDDATLDALDRVQSAASGAGASTVDPAAPLLNPNLSPEEFWQGLEAHGLVDNS